jgi:hypothetical protein
MTRALSMRSPGSVPSGAHGGLELFAGAAEAALALRIGGDRLIEGGRIEFGPQASVK